VPAVLRDRVVILICLQYALLGFLWVIFEEVFPLWSVTEQQYGGIGLSQSNIGVIQSIGGAFTLIFQIFLYPSLAKRLSLVGTFRYGILIGLPGFLLVPEVRVNVSKCHFYARLIDPFQVVYLLRFPSYVLYGVLIFLVMLQMASSEMTFVSVFILISNSAHPHHMGAVNGLGQSLVSMLRTFGPFMGAYTL
jgi:hypothetical protein